MFKNLTDFSYKRNWKEAIGFYLAFVFLYYLIYLAIGLFPALLFSIKLPVSMLVTITSVGYILIIDIFFLKDKKTSLILILLILLNLYLSYSGGALLSLAIAAIISTMASKYENLSVNTSN